MPFRKSGLFCIPALVLIFVFSVAVLANNTPSHGSVVLSLQQVPLFARLDETQLRKVAEIAELRQGQKGEHIITQGKRIGKMSVALDSKVQIRIDGKLIVVLPVKSLVGEIEFLIDVPATADVVLNKISRVLVLENRALRKVMDANPRIGYVLMDGFASMEAQRLRETNQRQQK